jgi:CubicO group peptidase (beta-lactamase class C family)
VAKRVINMDSRQEERHAIKACSVFLLFSAVMFATPVQAEDAALGKFIAAYAPAHKFNGAIAVVVDSKPAYRGAFGTCERAFAIPCAPDGRFWIASVTKAFTATLALMLVEGKKLSLDATIRSYLPHFQGEGGDRITIHQLLNHTSGLPNPDTTIGSAQAALAHGMAWYQLPATPDELIARFYTGPLRDQPGKSFSYNNGDYIILGRIIEKVTGQTFDQVLAARILTPLGMKDTGMLHQDEIVARLAPAYFGMSDRLVNDMPVYPENWFAAGGMYSTVDDLQRFAAALYGGRLLARPSLNAMLTPGLDGYGLGVWIGARTFGGKSYRDINRPGSIMGANASFYHFDGNGRAIDITILSNTDQTNMDTFSRDIGRELLGNPPR